MHEASPKEEGEQGLARGQQQHSGTHRLWLIILLLLQKGKCSRLVVLATYTRKGAFHFIDRAHIVDSAHVLST